jgi:hypothetical protein
MWSRAMKHVGTAAASGFAISLFLTAAPAMAQGSYSTPGGERVGANGMPATHSTPAEQAQTRALNNGISQSNAAADAQAAQAEAQYRQQSSTYADQSARYQDALRRNQAQQRDYSVRREAYESLRDRYAAERAAYHRHEWPHYRDHRWAVLDRDSELMGERVQLISGARVGTVIDVSRSPGGRVQGLLVRLDGGKHVWIDNADVRYNRTDGILMTNLDRHDLWAMADERL